MLSEKIRESAALLAVGFSRHKKLLSGLASSTWRRNVASATSSSISAESGGALVFVFADLAAFLSLGFAALDVPAQRVDKFTGSVPDNFAAN